MLRNLLYQMGYEGLSALCNPSVLGIISEFEGSPDPKRLAEIILEIYGPSSLLGESSKRKRILEYLSEKEASSLCLHIGIKAQSNPWEALSKAKFTLDRTQNLFSFFGCDYHASEKEEDSKQDREFCQVIRGDYSLFPHQEVAARKIKSFLKQERARVLLHMPTGSGKTRTAMSIACDYIRNSSENRTDMFVVWLADTEELCDQAASEFEKAWKTLGVGETNLYRIHGDIKSDLSEVSHGMIIFGLQKLNSISATQQAAYYELCSNTSLVIFDEAHKAVATTYKHSVDVFQSAGKSNLIGLSATPGRSTFDKNENREFARFFKGNKVSLVVEGYDSPIDYLQDKGYLAKVIYKEIPYDETEIEITDKEFSDLSNGEEISKGLLERLGLDQRRNVVILKLAISLVEQSKKIILFAPSVESAEGIFSLLKYKGIKAGLVTSSTDPQARRFRIDAYRAGKLDVLVNFGVLTTGFDAPITNVAIIARPTNSLTLFSQMVGRAIRGKAAGGNDNAEIYVIKDTLPGLRDMTSAFSHWDESWGID